MKIYNETSRRPELSHEQSTSTHSLFRENQLPSKGDKKNEEGRESLSKSGFAQIDQYVFMTLSLNSCARQSSLWLSLSSGECISMWEWPKLRGYTFWTNVIMRSTKDHRMQRASVLLESSAWLSGRIWQPTHIIKCIADPSHLLCRS